MGARCFNYKNLRSLHGRLLRARFGRIRSGVTAQGWRTSPLRLGRFQKSKTCRAALASFDVLECSRITPGKRLAGLAVRGLKPRFGRRCKGAVTINRLPRGLMLRLPRGQPNNNQRFVLLKFRRRKCG
jgi:hypothetical protein